jgi:hypothetical protein
MVEITVKPFTEKDSAETIPDLAIDLRTSDLAENIDHYLYGLPKHSKLILYLLTHQAGLQS